MIERIASRRLARLLLIDDLELFGHLRRRLVVPVQAEKRWVERGNVMGEHVRRIAPRVDGDEQNLNPARIGPELLHCGGELCERRRAEVRALRVAEKNDDCLAAEVGERARLAVVIDEMKVAAEGGAGHIGALEFGRCRSAGRDRQRERQNGQQAHQCQ